MALTQGFFLKSFKNTQKTTLNGMKVCALPTQAKADTVELCSSVKKIVVASSELAIINIDSSDVGGASWWVELAGGWGWP